MLEKVQTTADVAVGDFLQYTLVTDTVVVEVVKKTDKTLWLRTTQVGEKVRVDNVDGNPYPVIYDEILANPETGKVFKLRERKNGGFRYAETYGTIYPATTIDGVPVKRTDYRY